MPISYGLVARGPVVLCEYFPASGNFTDIARRILQKVPARSDRKSYGYEGQIFHYISDDLGLIVMCMADEQMSHRICFSYLQEIRQRFLGLYEDAFRNGAELSFNDRFSRTLKDRMEFFSNDIEADKVRKIRSQIDEVQHEMKQNIDKVLIRGEQVETLVVKTDTLQGQGDNFRKVSTKLRRNLWWKNMKTWILLFLTIFACVFIVTIVILMALKVIP